MTTEEICRLAKSSVPLALDAEMTRIGLLHTGCFWESTDSCKPGPVLATYTTSYDTRTTYGQENHREGRIDCWIIAKDPRPHSDELPIEIVDGANTDNAGWAVKPDEPPILAAWIWADTGRVRVAAYGILRQTVHENRNNWHYSHTLENGIYHRGRD